MTRILFLTFDLWNSPGGIQRYGKSLLEVLGDLPEVSVDCAIVGSQNSPVSDIGSDYCKVHWLVASSRLMRYFKVLWFMLWSMRPGEYSLVIVLHARLLPMLVLWRFLPVPFVSRSAPKVVLVQHGVEVWKKPSLLQKFSQALVTMTVSVSSYTRARAAQCWWKYNSRAPIVDRDSAVPDTLIPGTVTSACSESATFPSGDSSEVLLVTVTRLSAEDNYKGVDRVLTVIPSLKEHFNIRYVIVGDGDDRGRLESIVRDKLLLDCVEFRGFQTDQQVHALLTQANCFVLPSSGEGLGLATLEALVVGCPVVVGDSDGARELLVDPCCGIAVCPNDSERLLEALITILSSHEGSQKRLDRREKVLAEFEPKQFRKRWSLLVDDLLDCRGDECVG